MTAHTAGHCYNSLLLPHDAGCWLLVSTVVIVTQCVPARIVTNIGAALLRSYNTTTYKYWQCNDTINCKSDTLTLLLHLLTTGAFLGDNISIQHVFKIWENNGQIRKKEACCMPSFLSARELGIYVDCRRSESWMMLHVSNLCRSWVCVLGVALLRYLAPASCTNMLQSYTT